MCTRNLTLVHICAILIYEWQAVQEGRAGDGKRTGAFYREENRGKGSHERVYYGHKFTTVKHGEIGPGLLAAMCRQLGINKRDL